MQRHQTQGETGEENRAANNWTKAATNPSRSGQPQRFQDPDVSPAPPSSASQGRVRCQQGAYLRSQDSIIERASNLDIPTSLVPHSSSECLKRPSPVLRRLEAGSGEGPVRTPVGCPLRLLLSSRPRLDAHCIITKIWAAPDVDRDVLLPRWAGALAGARINTATSEDAGWSTMVAGPSRDAAGCRTKSTGSRAQDSGSGPERWAAGIAAGR